MLAGASIDIGSAKISCRVIAMMFMFSGTQHEETAPQDGWVDTVRAPTSATTPYIHRYHPPSSTQDRACTMDGDISILLSSLPHARGPRWLQPCPAHASDFSALLSQPCLLALNGTSQQLHDHETIRSTAASKSGREDILYSHPVVSSPLPPQVERRRPSTTTVPAEYLPFHWAPSLPYFPWPPN